MISSRAIVRKELELLKRLGDEIEIRLPAGLSQEEQILLGQAIVKADPELVGLVAELEELADLRATPPLWRGQQDVSRHDSDGEEHRAR